MRASENRKKLSIKEMIWNFWCIISIIGIWPRFIEPFFLLTSRLTIKLPQWPKPLEGLKIIQISDLHYKPGMPDFLLNRIVKKITEAKPDLIFFTGDFLSESELPQPKRLKDFLSKLQAKYGCYAIAGNHDYSSYISINRHGDYDVIAERDASLNKGIERLLKSPILTKKVTRQAKETPLHSSLLEVLADTPFTFLHNQTIQIKIRDSFLNLCGLGEYTAGRFKPDLAFQNYRPEYPGIILTHNPDSAPLLKNHPGELVLCGHTHGAQINIPFLDKKFTLMENPQWKRGLHRIANKWVYINRGLGSVFPFRWFSPPEILSLTIRGEIL